MKFEIESHDVDLIVQRVSETLRPLLLNTERHEDKSAVLDVKGLAEYLHVDCSWVYKQVSLKEIPFFKAGRYTRFRKRDIDRWIDGQTRRPIPVMRLTKIKGVPH